MSKEDLILKLTSRKFLLSLAAFLASFFTGVTGVLPAEFCAIGMALSAGIYAACEAYVDGQNAKSTQTVIQASSTDKTVVAKLLVPEDAKEE